MLDVELDLNAWAASLKVPTLKQQAATLNRQWAKDSKARLQEKYSGDPMSRYLTARTGKTRRNVRSRVTATGAELSVNGPGVFTQEFGKVITPKKGTPIHTKEGTRFIPYLTFRLYQAQDTDTPTGRWVRARKVTIKAKYPARDSAREALQGLFLDLGDDP